MTSKIQEGDLTFSFRDAARADRLDEQGAGPEPEGMKLVDFVVERRDDVLLIEVKDPSHPRASAKERTRFSRKMQNDKLIHEELMPKARDSYTFLHLMERDTKRFLFVVLLGLETLDDKALLVSFKERLLARLRKEAGEPWRRFYVSDCLVLTLETWPDYFPRYSVSRA